MKPISKPALDWVTMQKAAIFISAILISNTPFLKNEFISNIYASSDETKVDNPDNIKMIPLPGFTPNENDDSLTVSFVTPDGMVEDGEAARRNGIYKVYKSADSRQVHPESVISISFSKKKGRVLDLNSFILGNTQNLEKLFPDQKLVVGLLHLPEDVVKKFEDMAIPYQVILFFVDAGVNQLGHNCAIFFFETPDGFWSINWTAPREILEREGRERGIFLSLIMFTIIEIMRPDGNIEIHM